MTKIIDEIKLDFDDVLIQPKRSLLNSRSDVNLIRTFNFPNTSKTLECAPIMIANMDSVGTIDMANSVCPDNAVVCLHKHYDPEQLISLYNNSDICFRDLIFYSTGTSAKDINKLEYVFAKINNYMPNICLDVANGYTEQFVKTAKHIRKLCPHSIIMAGNVVTPEMTEELIIHGKIDIVKVGIGSGSVCTTRLKTGVGYPQLSAILECSDAAHGLGGHICSDGGCKTPADICKALGANADFVMIGGMLAGTDCCEGEWEYEYRQAIINNDGTVRNERWQPFDPGYKEPEKRKKSLKFYGMSSKEAMNKHHGGVANYRTSEGKCVNISYKGKSIDVLYDIYGGMRSACTYIGTDKIKDFGKKTTFIRVNNTHNKVFEK